MSVLIARKLVKPSSGRRMRVIVAIPAKDEAVLLPECLHALCKQRDKQGRPASRDTFGIVVFANNCSDDTAEVARFAARHAPHDIRVVEARMPPCEAHAGGARRAAMDLAESWLRELKSYDGVIMTTDADSRVAPDWVSANLNAFAQGADAVLGSISLDEEGERLPAALHARGHLEEIYETLLAEISALLDPIEENPWPYHSTISGASLAVARKVYIRVGGMPRVPLGEDKALVAALRLHDARIRFDPNVRVVTSGRVLGRAPGGVADTLRLRSFDPTALCDEAVEPCLIAIKRALWRGRLRRRGLDKSGPWRKALRVPARTIRKARATSAFGAVWARIERESPALAKSFLAPQELPREIYKATRALRWLQARASSHSEIRVITPPLMARETDCVAEPGDEKIAGTTARVALSNGASAFPSQ
jgi:cellulose synthase/poly-beta-1,6-N-acetylglucosamine synthase-like glycosyltransferase